MKHFGIKADEIILSVDDSKLTIDLINQIRKYLDLKEKELKKLIDPPQTKRL